MKSRIFTPLTFSLTPIVFAAMAVPILVAAQATHNHVVDLGTLSG